MQFLGPFFYSIIVPLHAFVVLPPSMSPPSTLIRLLALPRVKSKRIFVRPNVGSMNQCRLFHKMGWKIDVQHEKYKVYRMRLAADKVRKGKYNE